MQFMLMMHEDLGIYEGPEGAALMEATVAGHMKLGEDLVAAGVSYSGERLKTADTATTLRWDQGKATLHDGPFAETHEELGGFYIIDVAGLDEALEWARRIPIPGKGAIEVRPVWPMDF